MGYRVEYQTVRKVRRMEQKKSGQAALTAVFFVVFLILTTLLWPEGREVLREAYCFFCCIENARGWPCAVLCRAFLT